AFFQGPPGHGRTASRMSPLVVVTVQGPAAGSAWGTLIRPTVEDTAQFLAVSRRPSTSPLVVVIARLAAAARSTSSSPLLVSVATAPAAVVRSRLPSPLPERTVRLGM